MTRGAHCIEKLLGLRTSLDAEDRRKSLSPAGDRTPFVQPLTIMLNELPRLSRIQCVVKASPFVLI
jgi:hypothetical protein